MIKIKNTENYNSLRRRVLGGKITGIWNKSDFFVGQNSFPVLKYHYLTSNFAEFEKNIFKESDEITYHLSGYGVKWNEALVSFLGESSERYSFVSFIKLIEDKIVYDSYSSLKKNLEKNEIICPLEYINVYFNEDNIENYLLEEDKVLWVQLKSLVNLDYYVYIPLQLLIPYNHYLFSNEKKIIPTAVSTGTACHETFFKSLENALIEYLQIDSFNLWWYGGVAGKEIEIDMMQFFRLLTEDEGIINYFLENFNFKFTDISLDKSIKIIVCEAFGKNKFVPQYTIGVQGGRELKQVMYRGFMECIAVVEYNLNIPWIDLERYKKVNETITHIGNLDDNVILYSKYGKPEKIVHKENYHFNKYIKNLNNGNIFKNLKELSEYGGFLDISLPEFEHLNFKITRICIPELLPLCLPSYPPYFHPRYKEIGGIKNYVPHPLA